MRLAASPFNSRSGFQRSGPPTPGAWGCFATFENAKAPLAHLRSIFSTLRPTRKEASEIGRDLVAETQIGNPGPIGKEFIPR